MDRPMETLSQFELLAGLHAVAIHNLTVRKQLEELGAGTNKEELDEILANGSEFEFLGYVKQDQTEGCVYILPDGKAYLKECSTDLVFRLKGEKEGMTMRADGSRASRFPEILAVCMESTKRPMGFVWHTDLKEGWQEELGAYMSDLLVHNVAPDPQRFLAWTETRSQVEVEYIERCVRDNPYLEENELIVRVMEGDYQQQSCQDIMYAGLPIMVGCRAGVEEDSEASQSSTRSSPPETAGEEGQSPLILPRGIEQEEGTGDSEQGSLVIAEASEEEGGSQGGVVGTSSDHKELGDGSPLRTYEITAVSKVAHKTSPEPKGAEPRCARGPSPLLGIRRERESCSPAARKEGGVEASSGRILRSATAKRKPENSGMVVESSSSEDTSSSSSFSDVDTSGTSLSVTTGDQGEEASKMDEEEEKETMEPPPRSQPVQDLVSQTAAGGEVEQNMEYITILPNAKMVAVEIGAMVRELRPLTSMEVVSKGIEATEERVEEQQTRRSSRRKGVAKPAEKQEEEDSQDSEREELDDSYEDPHFVIRVDEAQAYISSDDSEDSGRVEQSKRKREGPSPDSPKRVSKVSRKISPRKEVGVAEVSGSKMSRKASPCKEVVVAEVSGSAVTTTFEVHVKKDCTLAEFSVPEQGSKLMIGLKQVGYQFKIKLIWAADFHEYGSLTYDCETCRFCIRPRCGICSSCNTRPGAVYKSAHDNCFWQRCPYRGWRGGSTCKKENMPTNDAVLIRLWLKDVNTFCLGITDEKLKVEVRNRLALYNMVINGTVEEERMFWSSDARAFQYPSVGKLGDSGVHETYMAIEIAKYKAAMAIRIIKTELRLNPDWSFSVLRHKTNIIYRESAAGQSKNKPAITAPRAQAGGKQGEASGGRKMGGNLQGNSLLQHNFITCIFLYGKKGGGPLRTQYAMENRSGELLREDLGILRASRIMLKPKVWNVIGRLDNWKLLFQERASEGWCRVCQRETTLRQEGVRELTPEETIFASRSYSYHNPAVQFLSFSCCNIVLICTYCNFPNAICNQSSEHVIINVIKYPSSDVNNVNIFMYMHFFLVL